MNVIDSNILERDAGGKPLHTFPHPALGAGIHRTQSGVAKYPLVRPDRGISRSKDSASSDDCRTPRSRRRTRLGLTGQPGSKPGR
ncbi:hypothetical protein Nwi_0612 [Nitrobacter winogradskyi Nb-255]|uniref:Uncharacterized protein n=1 Tax=Nitrobacter winogradskyi (strain ATCC 25391 / DSM 10237 / CIP 104748 / NCIMB 11846 / Nb-255) TaxID=323098 RepID=Q3SV12_NITWN|nr:hypothetical protein Nwi_0612 [Nitrobacter winogradskyi Nb-255]